MDYPQEWNDLSKYERRKKIKAWKREQVEIATKKSKSRKWTGSRFLVVAIFVGIYLKRPAMDPQSGEVMEPEQHGHEEVIEGNQHVPHGSEVEYQTNPPSSGNHYAEATAWGVYDSGLDDEAVVHALEHGGIWISYRDIDEETIEKLEKIAKKNKGSVVLSPRSENDTNIAIVSWGRILKQEVIDEQVILEFIKQNKNNSPEKLAY